MKYSIINELHGKTCTKVEVVEELSCSGNQAVVFHVLGGGMVALTHEQDCCEDVRVEDIVGDISDLVGSPLIEAEVASHEPDEYADGDDSETWTYYKLGTVKGCASIRWVGSSNGYYSEDVDVICLNDDGSRKGWL